MCAETVVEVASSVVRSKNEPYSCAWLGWLNTMRMDGIVWPEDVEPLMTDAHDDTTDRDDEAADSEAAVAATASAATANAAAESAAPDKVAATAHASFDVNLELFDRGARDEDDQKRFARIKLKVRTSAALDSSIACDDVPAGAAVSIHDRKELSDGTRRVLISLVRLGSTVPPIGWISEVTKDGHENLLRSSPFRRRGRSADERLPRRGIALAQSAVSMHWNRNGCLVPPRPYWEPPLPTPLAEGLTEPLTAPVFRASSEHVSILMSAVTQQEHHYRQILERGFGFETPAPTHVIHERKLEPAGSTPRLKTPLPKEAKPRDAQAHRTTPRKSRTRAEKAPRSVPTSSFVQRPYWEHDPERKNLPMATALQISGVVTVGPFGMPPASEFKPWLATSSSAVPLFDRDPIASKKKRNSSAAPSGTAGPTHSAVNIDATCERLSHHRWQWVRQEATASITVPKRNERALALEGDQKRAEMLTETPRSDTCFPEEVPWKAWYTHCLQK